MKIPYPLRVFGYWLKFHLTGKKRIKPTVTFYANGKEDIRVDAAGYSSWKADAEL